MPDDNTRSTSGEESLTYQSSDGLSLHYVSFPGPESGTPVLCLPGLTRNVRDFRSLARLLSVHRRVICLEFRGRGQSQWDSDPSNYQAPQYVADTLALIEKEQLDRIIVVGTSLGGLVGTGLVQVKPGLVAGIVLNDIGPAIDSAGLERIGSYLGHAAEWQTWDAAAEKLKAVNAVVYPDFTDKDWLEYAQKTCRETADGKVTQDYDPALSQGFSTDSAANVELWDLFDALSETPALLLRGALSDLLSQQTAKKMLSRLPQLELTTISNRGHVPTLDEPEAITAIEAFVSKVDNLEDT